MVPDKLTYVSSAGVAMRTCSAAGTDLTDEEIKWLSALPDAAFELKATVECELEEEHAGPHCGLAQSDDRDYDDQTNYWIRWSAGYRKWTHEPSCAFEDEQTELSCLLPAGHEGGHDFGPPADLNDEDDLED